MKVLITGGTGLLGKKVSDILKVEYPEIEVYSIVRSTPSNKYQILLDLSTDWDIELLPKGIDAIIHLAQSEKYRDFPESSLDVFNVNTLSTLKLLNYGVKNGTRKFIYASSGGVYGLGEKPFIENEDIPSINDLGFYANSKLISESMINTYSSYFSGVILRFFFIYGSEQKSTMLIPRLITSVKDKISIKLTGENGMLINPIHVNDAARSVVLALLKDIKGVFNIGGSDILSLRQLVEVISEKLDQRPIFEIQKGEIAKNLIGNISKSKVFLVEPTIKFVDGIEDSL